ncbi:VC0807 family protein [Streptomyces sp. SCSIO ZS0520]|uniref:VC0807 family protein n=1 Tax=Streptomyces sp. SCSIO ZS0520 TaxID=2892996 RepID=UPI0021DA8997|nr:VC0807 family protein [Streptomyces sp. SCSIO ZS0520]
MTPPTPGSSDTPPPTTASDGEPSGDDAPSRSSHWGFALVVLCDIVLPVALYYLLRDRGMSEVNALLLSGSAPALHTVYSAARHRRLDAIGVFTMVLLVTSALATLLTDDPRIALARNGLFTALAGLWLLATHFTARPFTYQALRALLPPKKDLLERLWTTDASFRGVWRGLNILWGVGLLCDAGLRLLMAYTLPVDSVPVLDGVLYAASWILLQVITQITLHRSGTTRKIFGDLGRRKGRRPGRKTPSGRPAADGSASPH